MQWRQPPEAVRGLLERVAGSLRVKRATVDRRVGHPQELMRRKPALTTSSPRGWPYYAEKLRKANFDLDESELKPYFALDNMIARSIRLREQIWRRVATPRTDVPVWHPERTRVGYHSRDGRLLGTFFGDYFARVLQTQRRVDDRAARSAQD